jgi:Domain of unknown function (DUF4258)
MEYVLTEHAEKRLRRRKIVVEWITVTLENPARTENDRDDPDLAHALRPIPERGFRILRVVYNETVEPIRVVTAYFDDEVTDL